MTTVKKSAPKKKRVRLPPEERYEQILQRAITYFAEFGFEAGTRELARRLGVTQPLLYKYFPTKDELIRAVYERIYLNRWHPDWQELLTDRSRPLDERLIEFYKQYTSEIFSTDWLRIYLFSGLKGLPINQWYIEKVEENILCVCLREFYAEQGIPEDQPISRMEIEHAWILQGGIIYLGLRKYIYHTQVPEPIDVAIEDAVHLFLAGLGSQVSIDKAAAKRAANTA